MVIYYNVNTEEATCSIYQAKEWLEESDEICFDDWLIEHYFEDDLTEEDYERAREEFEIEVLDDIAWGNWDNIKVIQLDDQEVKNYISLGQAEVYPSPRRFLTTRRVFVGIVEFSAFFFRIFVYFTYCNSPESML